MATLAALLQLAAPAAAQGVQASIPEGGKDLHVGDFVRVVLSGAEKGNDYSLPSTITIAKVSSASASRLSTIRGR